MNGNDSSQKGLAGQTQSSGNMQHQNSLRPKCECHECTQARWRMQGGASLASAGFNQ